MKDTKICERSVAQAYPFTYDSDEQKMFSEYKDRLKEKVITTIANLNIRTGYFSTLLIMKEGKISERFRKLDKDAINKFRDESLSHYANITEVEIVNHIIQDNLIEVDKSYKFINNHKYELCMNKKTFAVLKRDNPDFANAKNVLLYRDIIDNLLFITKKSDLKIDSSYVLEDNRIIFRSTIYSAPYAFTDDNLDFAVLDIVNFYKPLKQYFTLNNGKYKYNKEKSNNFICKVEY